MKVKRAYITQDIQIKAAFFLAKKGKKKESVNCTVALTLPKRSRKINFINHAIEIR